MRQKDGGGDPGVIDPDDDGADANWGYGKQNADGSLNYLQQLTKELADLKARNPGFK